MEPEKRHTYFVLVGLLSFLCIYTVIPHSRLIDSVTLLFDQRYYYDKVFRDTEVKNDSVPSQNMIAQSSTNTGGAYKKMLIWTKWNSEQLAYDQHNQPGWFKNCPESRCLAVTNRNERKQASAIIFYMPDFNPKDLPHQSARNRSVYYIFHLDESPDTTKKLMNYRAWDNHPGFFNLTMSYRLDSDIYSDLYTGGYTPRHFNQSRLTDPLWYASKRDILWLVSHCDTASKREDYAAELGKYVSIDKLGKCDQPDPCRHKHGANGCDSEDLIKHFKFYLSFENSICQGYATEKLYRALNNDVVPIVLGGADYKKLLPPGAVINVEDYPSPKALAEYLIHLMRNEEAYLKHFAWKYPPNPLWYMPGIPTRESSSFCKICELLHRPPKERIRKSYENMNKWWFAGQCRESTVNYKKNQSEKASQKEIIMDD